MPHMSQTGRLKLEWNRAHVMLDFLFLLTCKMTYQSLFIYGCEIYKQTIRTFVMNFPEGSNCFENIEIAVFC